MYLLHAQSKVQICFQCFQKQMKFPLHGSWKERQTWMYEVMEISEFVMSLPLPMGTQTHGTNQRIVGIFHKLQKSRRPFSYGESTAG